MCSHSKKEMKIMKQQKWEKHMWPINEALSHSLTAAAPSWTETEMLHSDQLQTITILMFQESLCSC